MRERLQWEVVVEKKEVCDVCNYHDVYGDIITCAKTADRFDCAARLLLNASGYIKNGQPVPEPLAKYIAQVLEDTATIAMTKGIAKERNAKIVKALNLSIVKSPLKTADPRDVAGLEIRRKALKYMYKRIKRDGVSLGKAATEAAEKFPFDDCDKDRPESDHRSLYERTSKEEIEEWISYEGTSSFM